MLLKFSLTTEVNAFALPNGHLVIYSGLILNSDNQEQFSGVICHEIAHIRLKHVIKKLIKELGFSVIISMTTGSYGSEARTSSMNRHALGQTWMTLYIPANLP